MSVFPIIDLRSQIVGARVARPTEEVELPRLTDRLVLLVHGYATNRRSALQEYNVFAHNLRYLSRCQRLPSDMTVVGVHWPGDDRNPFVNKSSFNARVGDAEVAGGRLRELLRDSSAKSVIIVGHSLGCRLVLSALLGWAGNDFPDLEVTMLMAAAVPEEHCASGAIYGPEAISEPEQAVLYSKRDLVLWGLFRPGMRMAMGSTSPAVGRSGLPRNRWNHIEDVGLGHGDYWGSIITAYRLTELMGTSDRRRVPARSAPAHRVVPVYRAEEREVPELPHG